MSSIRRVRSHEGRSNELTAALPDGTLALFTREGSLYTLEVDQTPQSAVNVDDPTDLRFAYIRHMGHVIDLAFPAFAPVTALHLGAGALTIPRFIDATRPRSRQQVIELERDLVDFVRRVAPLPSAASIRIRYGDAREQLSRLPSGMLGSVDVAVVDIFQGSRTPAHVTTAEFYRELAHYVASDGIVLVNIADGHELRFLRGQAATLKHVFGQVALITDPQVFKGRRFGNIVAVASRQVAELEGLDRLVTSGFPPARVFRGHDVTGLIGNTAPVTDATASPSPLPGRGLFQQRRQSEW